MKKLLALSLFLAALIASCGGGAEKEKSKDKKEDSIAARVDTSLPQGMVIPEKTDSVKVQAQGKPGALVRIARSIDDKFSVLAGLKTAEDLAAKFAVVIYFDLRGVALALKETPDIDFAPYTKSKTQLKKLRDLGVTMVVSRTALGAVWKKAEDLEPGITIGDPADVLSFTDGKIVTLEF